MTDERGGRYFREARFFLAGDKVVAQSHILEARSLMGYMRDMQALGGPPIQAQYATLQDGTRIKATMMNGQYQAEIISPSASRKARTEIVPTFIGVKYLYGGAIQKTHAFKWQEATGTVLLEMPTGAVSTRAYSMTADGSRVWGTYSVPDDVYVALVAGAVVWGPEGQIETSLSVHSSYIFAPLVVVVDFEKGDASPLSVPYPHPAGNVMEHRFLTDGPSLFMGQIYGSGENYAAAVRRTDSDVMVLNDTTGPLSQVYAASADASVLTGFYGTDFAAALWRRGGDTGIYTRGSIPGAESAYDVTDDGIQVICQIPRHRGDLTDYVPAVWTEADGLMQLEEFDPDPPPASFSITEGRYIHSKGGLVAGSFAAYAGAQIMFWRYDELGVTNRYAGPIGELTGGN